MSPTRRLLAAGCCLLSHAPGWLAGWLAWLAGGQLARMLTEIRVELQPYWKTVGCWLAAIGWLAAGGLPARVFCNLRAQL